MADPGVGRETADGTPALLIILGALLCLFGGALVVLALMQQFEFGAKAFWSGHGGTFMLLAFGAPLLALGVLAFRFAARRSAKSVQHDI